MGKKIRQILEGQQPLPFRGNRTGLLAYARPWERNALLGSGFILGALVILYVYFMIASVVDVAQREELAQNATKLSAEVARLEAQYLSKTHTITESVARDHGFVSVSSRTFVEKASAVSLNNVR